MSSVPETENDETRKNWEATLRQTATAAGELAEWHCDRGEVMQFAGRTTVRNDIGLSSSQTDLHSCRRRCCCCCCCCDWWWCGFAMQSLLDRLQLAVLSARNIYRLAEVFYIQLLCVWTLHSAVALSIVRSTEYPVTKPSISRVQWVRLYYVKSVIIYCDMITTIQEFMYASMCCCANLQGGPKSKSLPNDQINRIKSH